MPEHLGAQPMNHLLHELEHEQYGISFPRSGCEPEPVQSPSIQLWVGRMGQRRTLRVVAEVADGRNTLLMPEEEYRHKLDCWPDTARTSGGTRAISGSSSESR